MHRNRLVEKWSDDESDAVIQTSVYAGDGGRMMKVVTNSGQLDKTEVYLYDGQRIIEIRDGSNNMVQQFIHGTQYIDEIVMIHVAGKGELYIHQAERAREGSVKDWNVIATTDMGGHVVERTILTPYGELSIEQETSWGDYDGDNDVDADDRPVPLPSVCGQNFSGACRIIDLNFDGAYSFADRFAHPYLPPGLARHPGLTATATQQPFAHQGLFFEEEVGQYQNRARQYLSEMRRFAQRDLLATRSTGGKGHQDGMNLYAFESSRPTRNVDPFGLAVLDCAAAVDRCFVPCDYIHGACKSACGIVYAPGTTPWVLCVYNTCSDLTNTCARMCDWIGAYCNACKEDWGGYCWPLPDGTLECVI